MWQIFTYFEYLKILSLLLPSQVYQLYNFKVPWPFQQSTAPQGCPQDPYQIEFQGALSHIIIILFFVSISLNISEM